MSLESSITDLVAKAQSLIDTFSGKKNEINQAVQAAVAAAPLSRKKLYLNETSGSDDADGLTEATALKTFKKALSMGTIGGELWLYVVGDINLTEPIYYVPTEMKLKMFSTAKKANGDAYNLRFNVVDDGVGGKRISALCGSYSSINITFDRLGIEFASNPSNLPLSSTVMIYPSISGSMGSRLKIYDAAVVSVGKVGLLLGGRPYNEVGLYLYNTTYNTSDMAGKWISGVTAGKLPTDYPDVFTNLASL